MCVPEKLAPETRIESTRAVHQEPPLSLAKEVVPALVQTARVSPSPAPPPSSPPPLPEGTRYFLEALAQIRTPLSRSSSYACGGGSPTKASTPTVEPAAAKKREEAPTTNITTAVTTGSASPSCDPCGVPPSLLEETSSEHLPSQAMHKEDWDDAEVNENEAMLEAELESDLHYSQEMSQYKASQWGSCLEEEASSDLVSPRFSSTPMVELWTQDGLPLLLHSPLPSHPFANGSELDEEPLAANTDYQTLVKDYHQAAAARLTTQTSSQRPSTALSSSSASSVADYGLSPEVATQYFVSRRVQRLYQWQRDVLTWPCIRDEGRNLVYSLPTSGGKTLVAEVCLLRGLLKQRRSTMLVVPFISIAEEKASALRPLGEKLGFHVDEQYGTIGRPPPPLEKNIPPRLFVCTIEKANSLLNFLLEEGRAAKELSVVVVDELHMLSEARRGATLELFLSKLLLLPSAADAVATANTSGSAHKNREEAAGSEGGCQIISMSATVANLKEIAAWLRAEVYESDFRPVPLMQYAVVDGERWKDGLPPQQRIVEEKEGSALPSPLPRLEGSELHQLYALASEVPEDASVLIFCATRGQCYYTAKGLAELALKDPHRTSAASPNPEMDSLLHDLATTCSQAFAQQLRDLLPSRVGFHHGGLLQEERQWVELQFSQTRSIRWLCCTSTLAAGVNLPARRVLFRSPYTGKQFLTISRYRQMSGRAGRANLDSFGDSFLILHQARDRFRGCALLQGAPERCESQLLEDAGELGRAMLELIETRLIRSWSDMCRWGSYLLCRFAMSTTAASTSKPGGGTGASESPVRASSPPAVITEEALANLLDHTVRELKAVGLVSEKGEGEEREWEVTALGCSAVRSCFSIEEALIMRAEFDNLRLHGLILSDELHLCYFLTPLREISLEMCDWERYRDLLARLSDDRQRIASLIGVNECYVYQRAMGLTPAERSAGASSLLPRWSPNAKKGGESAIDLVVSASKCEEFIVCRFYVALLLSDALHEVPVEVLETRYKVTRGQIQHLMRSASMFSRSMTRFCNALEWFALEAALASFIDRLGFGVKPELVPLMELKSLTPARARAVWNAGFRDIPSLGSLAATEGAAAATSLVAKVRATGAPDNLVVKFFSVKAATAILTEAVRWQKSSEGSRMYKSG